ncbi:PLP-dependent aminotransferase family protein [Ciceribacter sp. L1K22]|uniref:aminotransferase-like domain-containing protein n=1 Tax=Ciceribacter sp. L1K22 TaxID=2820275 RepID=UPI001ABDD549|nr:PLP-dependent aminotransferase family protein [Ciceribacter sp. L1K22]MBO3761068.1 PLP-dependent aminotransferase family protein [Ciceribacter sp. L1K22]
MDQTVTHPDTTGTSRVEHVMATIRQRIASRTLQPGSRLPSIRQCATSLKVSPSTVVEAYDRLVSDGLILSRPGSGFYVAAAHPAPLVLAEIAPRLDRAVDPFWVSRQALEAGAETLKPGCGWLPPSWFPERELRRALRDLSRAEDTLLTDYGTPRGLPPLRQLIARRMSERGIETSPDRILLTESGVQALDFVCRFLLEPGDTVLVDDPCYFNFLALLRAHRVTAVGVPYTGTGPDVEAFAAALATHKPRLYVTNSGLHNPTGASLSPVAAHRILKLAEAAGLTIVEDDIFADFEQDPAPRLAAFDGFERVIQLGSFSKTVSASARLGYIAARPDWIESLIDLKIAGSFGGNALSAALTLSVLKDGGYRHHLATLKTRLASAMGETIRRLAPLGIRPWLEPRGGLYLWCRLPDGLDAAEIARKALAENVILAPGNVFSVSQTAGDFLRFNVSQSADPRIFNVLERVLDARN